ncbi:hypothetical protein SeMB42_g03538 [Synchytrium endobioticum]|uniref:Ribosomal lysine N-methyltransferase 4 n=1 Tax=Synchytrium endobioticum TaxID=286115 RepID=A0A507DI55_9FUNG|nr:hypothetical protein SeMB42_g03538 [Synchytrium endobioticum]TPX51274.1 hypothetical protein SeLEV6574_g00365 [Synchytrium endobioticum]
MTVNDPTSKLQNLLNWFTDNDIKFNNQMISVTTSSSSAHTGLCIMAETDLNLGDVVCEIPKASVLSCKTTAIADILEEFNLAGVLGLTVSVMFEMSQGSQSPWYEYLQAMPEREDIPLFWCDPDSLLLENTDLIKQLAKDIVLLELDWKDDVLPMFKKYPELFPPASPFYSFDEFLRATSLVTSRAFQVDAYHLDAMVPLADIFNHKTASENVHIETDGDVCLICGANYECEHVTSEFDTEASSDTNSIHHDDDNGATPDNDLLQMVIVKPDTKGSEVFNTYGNHSNSVLLSRYGFCELGNPFDTVSIEWDDVLTVLSDILPCETVLERVEWWKVVCDGLNCDDHDNEADHHHYNESECAFTAEGECNPMLEGALRIALSPPSFYHQLRKDKHKLGTYIHQLNSGNWIVSKTVSSGAERDGGEGIDSDEEMYDSGEDTSDSVVATRPSVVSRKVRTIAAGLADMRLSKYKKTLEQDRIELDQLGAELGRMRWALILRISEKQILQKVISNSDGT